MTNDTGGQQPLLLRRVRRYGMECWQVISINPLTKRVIVHVTFISEAGARTWLLRRGVFIKK